MLNHYHFNVLQVDSLSKKRRATTQYWHFFEMIRKRIIDQTSPTLKKVPKKLAKIVNLRWLNKPDDTRSKDLCLSKL